MVNEAVCDEAEQLCRATGTSRNGHRVRGPITCVGELMARPVEGPGMPYVWLDATYSKCRRGGRVASTAAVTAIGCDEDGHRVVLGKDVVDTESYDSWLSFLRRVRARGVRGVQFVVYDAYRGLRRAIEDVS